MSSLEIGNGGPHERNRIHARMIVEMPVLKLDKRLCETLRNAVPRGKAPLPVGSHLGPQQFAFCTFQDGGIFHSLEKDLGKAAKPNGQGSNPGRKTNFPKLS